MDSFLNEGMRLFQFLLTLQKDLKKKSKLDKARFFNIAQGSAEECRYYLIFATDLKDGD